MLLLLWLKLDLNNTALGFGNLFLKLLYGILAAGNSFHSISKSFCGDISCLEKYLIKFSRTPGETAEAIAAFKETTNNKIPQAAGAIGSIHITILDPVLTAK